MKANGNVLRQKIFKSAIKSLKGKKINTRGKTVKISNPKFIKSNSGLLDRIRLKDLKINEKSKLKLYNDIGNSKKIEIKPVSEEKVKVFRIDELSAKARNKGNSNFRGIDNKNDEIKHVVNQNRVNERDRQDRLRERVLKNINESRIAREASNYKEFEKKFNRKKADIVGKTGEGIPLEKVKPDVLKQIHPDNNGAYGYLPNQGTAYHNPKYDFTNVDWAKDMQNVRKDYLEASKQLEIDIGRMTSEGFSKEDIAKHVVDARNQQKVTARSNMTSEERAGLEARNIKKYGNPIGPNAEGMFNKMKESYIDKGIFTSDNEIWETIIKKSMVKDDVINTLLGLIH